MDNVENITLIWIGIYIDDCLVIDWESIISKPIIDLTTHDFSLKIKDFVDNSKWRATAFISLVE
jgi:hypothetical protein